MARARAVLLALALAGALPARAEIASAPDPKTALVLVRGALLALDGANKTGNYAVLRDLGSPAFRASNGAPRLAAAFAPHRRAKLDLSAVAVLEPAWLDTPAVDAAGVLHLDGVFPSSSVELKFDLSFERVDAAWRVNALSLALTPARTAPPLPLTDLVLRR